MKRKKALKKQLKKLMKYSHRNYPLQQQLTIANEIVKIAREMRKGKKG